ncbi:hypothetical protein [Frisingicoccus sp.]|uniref:hypothetical protein n=1 Tax=Frisingicoccus sp. TaxID=1918627 RepID=UPI0025C292DA|nr:hypothetical protein [Frisingicoccus sp.]
MKETEWAQGEYMIDVTLLGGTGRADITSPAEIRITQEGVTALIEWSSPSYDYMIVDDIKYMPVNTEGNSVFEIPVTAFDEAIPVTADTVAMSVPHEIEYTLNFHSETMVQKQMTVPLIVQGGILIGVTLIIAAFGYYFGKKQVRRKHV